MNKITAIVRILRPKQWLKNVFVLMPVFFSGSLTHWNSLWAAVVAFIAFSFVASSVYCFNDIIDAEADRRHPDKCHRPVASGEVSKAQAYMLMALMFALGMLAPFLFHPRSSLLAPLTPHLSLLFVLLAYYVMNLGYCAWFKRYAIVDVCIIAFGFVLRLLAGGVATGVELSKWIVLMTFLLTLFLSFAKRRDDVVRMEQTGEAPRRNTSRYNLTFINQAITITGSVTLVCYIMYTVSPEVTVHFDTQYLYLTTVFVLLGLLRYIQLSVVDNRSGDPTKALLRDHFLQAVVLLWALAFAAIIYM